jgi:hypothetical protein
MATNAVARCWSCGVERLNRVATDGPWLCRRCVDEILSSPDDEPAYKPSFIGWFVILGVVTGVAVLWWLVWRGAWSLIQ